MTIAYYKKDDPTKVVKIIDDSKEAFYELSNGQMIKKDVFYKYYAPMENASINESVRQVRNTNSGDFIDPDTFFNSSSVVNQTDIMKIKNADPSKGAIEGSPRTEIVSNTTNRMKDAKPYINETIRPTTPMTSLKSEAIVQEVDESTLPIPDHTNTDVSKYKVYDNDDDAYADFIGHANNPQTQQAPQRPTPPPPPSEAEQLYDDEKMVYGEEEANRRRDIRLKKVIKTQDTYTSSDTQVQTEQKIQQPQMMDPREMMFKTFKRNYDIKINVEFTDKIANPEFIKMMMENMDGDIINFYKKLVLENITKNFKIVEDEVEKQLKRVIYGEETITETPIVITEKISEDSIIEVVEEPIVESSDYIDENGIVLILGGKTAAGKQLYKYIDERERVREVLPSTAKTKGWKPLIINHEN
jgi:hypothetical protein